MCTRCAVFLILLLHGLLFTVDANAGNLRGMVSAPISNGFAQTQVGRAGIPVTLAFLGPMGLAPVAQTITDGNGFYFFFNVMPGNYMLIVNNIQYPLMVMPVPAQDIPPIMSF